MACLRAYVLWNLRANVLACLAYLHAYVLGVLAFLACLEAPVFGVLTWLRAHAFSMLARFLSIRAHIFYRLTVLKYLTSQRDCVLLWHCLIFFIFEKLNSENFHIEKFLFIQKKCLESTYWTSMKEFLRKNLWLRAFNYFWYKAPS